MKKKNIAGVVILVAILIIGVAFIAHKFVFKKGKEYEVAKIEQYNYFVLKQNELFGVIDRSGNTIVPAQYDEIKIPNPEKAIFICYKNDSIEVLNENNEKILTQYEKVEPIRLKNIVSDLMYEKSVLKYSENGKYGLIDYSGKKITKPIYDEIDSLTYKEGEMLVKQNEKYGVINMNGYEIIEPSYDSISVDRYYTNENQYKNAGYIISNTTEEGYRYGYIDKSGSIITEPQYNELSRITQIDDNNNAYLICAKNGQYGVLKNKEEILENEYQSINYDEFNGLLVLEKSKKYGVSTLDGKIIVPLQYNQIDITGIYLYAQNDQGTTIYNNDGTQANIDNNISIINTTNEQYKIKINNTNTTKYGVIDNKGNQVIEEKYNYIEYLYDNYFIVSNENSKLGIIDDKDNTKVEIKYDSLQKIQNTNIIQAITSQTKVTEFYSKQMQKICEMENANIEVKENYFKIYNDTETKYFDHDGKGLKNTEVFEGNKLFAKSENGKWGFVDINSNKVVDYKYDRVTEFNEYGFAAVQKNGKWGAINEQGQEVIAPTYELDGKLNPIFIGKYYQVKYGFGEIYYTDNK